jgi:hypothetical protein
MSPASPGGRHTKRASDAAWFRCPAVFLGRRRPRREADNSLWPRPSSGGSLPPIRSSASTPQGPWPTRFHPRPEPRRRARLFGCKLIKPRAVRRMRPFGELPPVAHSRRPLRRLCTAKIPPIATSLNMRVFQHPSRTVPLLRMLPAHVTAQQPHPPRPPLSRAGLPRPAALPLAGCPAEILQPFDRKDDVGQRPGI